MAKWRFYGRQQQLKHLELSLRLQSEQRSFSVVRILGRRGVGKNALFEEAVRRGTQNVPVLVCELPPPVNGGPEALAESLEVAAEAAGLEDLHARLLPTLKRSLPQFRFCEMLSHLIVRGVMVVLDEFHHARKLGLEGQIKLMIDGFKKIGVHRPNSKLVVIGSHQQQMLRMFRCDQPLHGRVHSGVRLRQWRVSTVLEMAAEQGFLVHPGRFLTLWTAYGGMPGHWERFATHDDWRSLREFAAWDDDGEWRANFIETEQRYLDHNPEDRYDNRAFVELAEAHREALLHLANGPGRGCALKEFPNVLRRKADPTLKESLKNLAEHLELVEENHDFHGHNSRWRMADNNTRFQISVLRKRQAGTTRLRRKKVGSKVVKRLETHEGPALERLTAGWLDARPEEVDLAEHGVWLPDGKLADIDALAIVGLEEDWTLVLASCKRSAANHEPVRQRRQFEEFMAATGDSEEVLEIRRMPRRLLLVSPSFPADKRAECGDHGFECFGIRDMARAINLDLDRKAQSEDRHLRTRAHSGFGGDRDRS